MRCSAVANEASQQVDKFTADFNLSASDVKAVLGAISFILTNAAKCVVPSGFGWRAGARVAAQMMVECSPPPHRFRPLLALRYDVDMGVLINELCQLGLPKEHSESIGRCARRSLNAAAACASGMLFSLYGHFNLT